MGKLVFHRYKMCRLISIRQLSTAHYLADVKDYATPSHSHSAWELVFCSKGNASVWNGSQLVELHRGEVVFHMPGIPHHIKVGSAPATLFVISFICTNECMKLFSRKSFRVSGEQRAIIALMMNELRNAFELNQGLLQLDEFRPSASAQVGAEQLICGYLEWLLISMIRAGMNRMEPSVDFARLEEALETRIMSEIKAYVDSHLSERITIAQLAEHVHYSRAHITVQFKTATGMSIMDYVLSQRMEKAKSLITSGEHTISQISDMLGFASLQYFSRRFRQAVGCSPSSYADSLRDIPKPPFARARVYGEGKAGKAGS